MQIRGKSLHFICRDSSFYVLLNGRKITLERFVEAIKEKNKNAVFSHKMLSTKEFFYRNKQYKYSELENRHALNVEIASFYHNNHIAQKELLEYHTLKDGYIIRLLETLELRRKLVKENDTQFSILLCDCLPNQHDEKAYNVKQEFTIVRDWCNLLKHRGVLRFDGEKIQNAPKNKLKLLINPIPKKEGSEYLLEILILQLINLIIR